MQRSRACLANIDAAPMIKKLTGSLVILTLFCSSLAFGHDDDFYDEDEDEYFNRGKIVSEETDEWRKAERRSRYRNWGMALGATLIGITTFVLVAKDR